MGYGHKLKEIRKNHNPVVAQVVDADRHNHKKVEKPTEDSTVVDSGQPVKPTKAELLARAKELGLDVKSNASKDEVAAAVEAAEAEQNDEQ